MVENSTEFIKPIFVISVFRHNSFLCRSQQSTELIKLDLARAVFVNLLDQCFDVDCHLEILLDCVDQLSRINGTLTVRATTHSNERIK